MKCNAVFIVLLTLGAQVPLDSTTGVAGPGYTFTPLAGGHATGTNIPIELLTVTGAGANNGGYVVRGTCTDIVGGTYVGCLNFDTRTNTISITGQVSSLVIPLGPLLSGFFSSFAAGPNGLSDVAGSGSIATNLLTAAAVPFNQVFRTSGLSVRTGLSRDLCSSEARPERPRAIVSPLRAQSQAA